MRALAFLLLFAGCGSAAPPSSTLPPSSTVQPSSAAIDPALLTRIEAAEASARAELSADLLSWALYGGQVRARDDEGMLAAEQPDMGYADQVLEGSVVGVEGIGPDDTAPRIVTLFGDERYVIVGFGPERQVASFEPYFTYGGLDVACSDCLRADGDRLEVRGTFVGAYGDDSAQRVELDVRVARTTWPALSDADRARVLAALMHLAYLEPHGLEEDTVPRLEGSVLVFEVSTSTSLEIEGSETHGCTEILAYEAERRIDLSDPRRTETRAISLTGRFERCCPRDATGAPCSPGPRCDVRTL